MRLADLRRLAVRRQFRIHFSLQNGMECVITEHGIAQAPELKSAVPVNFEQDLASARQFVVESAEPGKSAAKPRTISREELEGMLGSSTAAASHEEE